MADKVWISRIEIGGVEPRCRVFLSDGRELDNITCVRPGVVDMDSFLTASIDVILGPLLEKE